MKYSVDVDGVRYTIDVSADGVVGDDAGRELTLVPVPGSPVWILRAGDAVHRLVVRPGATRGAYTISLGGYRFEIDALDERGRAIREMSRATSAATGPAPLKAPMPGLIVRVLVKPGDTVAAGDKLVVIEAMKMENELRSTSSGTVKAVSVTPGTAVEKGALLVELS
jgi:acetyl/propionyl-CoA carboxylase alpha subunit